MEHGVDAMEDWVEKHWVCVVTRIGDVRSRLADGMSDDEVAVRADIANVLHAAASLFELEVRRMARRHRPLASSLPEEGD